MAELHRDDPEYFRRALVQARKDGQPGPFGFPADAPPENFDELEELVASRRNPECGISNEIDQILGMIALDPDRDMLAARLPFHPMHGLLFVIPNFLEEGELYE